MQTHQLIQGSPEWHQHRANHWNASDAAAMLGISPHKTRSELLHEYHTGISKEPDWMTQERFNEGHRTEALARPIMERIIGEALSPVTVSDGKFSASCDGLTFNDDIAFEHKLLNEGLAAAIRSNELPEYHQPQAQQILMITGAKELYFCCSDGTSDNMQWMVVKPIKAWGKRLIDGWAQFEKDLKSYVPPEIEEKPIAEAVIALPALFVQIKGEVTTSNLPAFVGAADQFLANIKTELETDQDFADAEANVKACDTAEKGIEAAKKAITAQVADIDTVMRTMDLYRDKLRNVRLRLKKLVDTEKDARKQEIFQNAIRAFSNHVDALEAETKPIRLCLICPDFATAMKGLKKLSAMQDAVNTALANGKIAADAVAKDIRGKLAWCKENAAGQSALFPDLQQIIGKPMEDFALTVTSRIEAQKKAEANKLEAERARIQAEEESKARAKIEAERRAILEKEQAERNRLALEAAQRGKPQVGERERVLAQDPVGESKSTPPFWPTSDQLIEAVASVFDVDNGTALTWLSQADFTISDYVE